MEVRHWWQCATIVSSFSLICCLKKKLEKRFKKAHLLPADRLVCRANDWPEELAGSEGVSAAMVGKVRQGHGVPEGRREAERKWWPRIYICAGTCVM